MIYLAIALLFEHSVGAICFLAFLSNDDDTLIRWNDRGKLLVDVAIAAVLWPYLLLASLSRFVRRRRRALAEARTYGSMARLP